MSGLFKSPPARVTFKFRAWPIMMMAATQVEVPTRPAGSGPGRARGDSMMNHCDAAPDPVTVRSNGPPSRLPVRVTVDTRLRPGIRDY